MTPVVPDPVVSVANLRVSFGQTEAVRGVTLAVARGETHCLVDESGCGKSVTALSVMNLLPRGIARTADHIRFQGQDLVGLSERQTARLRGDKMAMIFQELILRLLQKLQQELGLALLLITHDLGVVARMAQRVSVMYAGEVVETGTVAEVLQSLGLNEPHVSPGDGFADCFGVGSVVLLPLDVGLHGRRDLQRQSRRKPARCQRTSVSGRIIMRTGRIDANQR